jgi:hypothetical protein
MPGAATRLTLSYPLITQFVAGITDSGAAITFFAFHAPGRPRRQPPSGTLIYSQGDSVFSCFGALTPIDSFVGDLIVMTDRLSDRLSQKVSQRDRRYAIRYPFAADADVLDLESGARADGVTSDISLGGCFICTSKPLSVKSRTRVTLTYKSQTVEALAMVRIVKPRIGMGLEFIDVEASATSVLARWLESLRRDR